METLRKPYQGIQNIIRFNWHYYVIVFISLMAMFVVNSYVHINYRGLVYVLLFFLGMTTIVSLIVSYYIYDRSNLYKLTWLNELSIKTTNHLLNITAGFDETSALLAKKYPEAKLNVLDFYDPKKHTEVSIKRAQKVYKAYPNTLKVNTTKLPLKNESMDMIFLILSAHEIRQDEERNQFFKELHRILKPEGNLIVVEHLRDFPNFLGFSIGFFHFLSRRTWLNTFKDSDFKIAETLNITPFINAFNLEKNGNTP